MCRGLTIEKLLANYPNCSLLGDDTAKRYDMFNGNTAVPQAPGKPRQSVSTTQAAVTQVRQVKSTSEAAAHDDALQVLENRLRDWMINNSPPSASDAWCKPFSVNGAPPRIAKLCRAGTDVRKRFSIFTSF